MSTSNPSHLLISRNPPRSPAHPQLAPTSTSRHNSSPGGGVGSSPLPSPRPGFLGRWHHSADELAPIPPHHSRNISTPSGTHAHIDDETTFVGEQGDEEEERVEIHPTFLQDAVMPGKVKVIVGRNEFWCHKEVLWFASPFFQGLLQGSWAETTRDLSSSVIESSSPPSVHVPSSPPTDTDPPATFEPGSARFKNPSDSWPGVSQLPSNEVSHPSLSRTLTGNTTHTEAESTGDLLCSDEDMDESSDQSRKTSVYLDASENGPGPSVAEILRELRELPETPAAGVRTIADVLDETPPTLSEVDARSSTTQLSLQIPNSQQSSSAISRDEAQIWNGQSQPHRTRLSRSRPRSNIRHSFSSVTAIRSGGSEDLDRLNVIGGSRSGVEAIVELHEESATAFQDFLFWAYPHLECKVTWTNVEDLLALASKLIVPALQKICEHFLITHASGRPVMALMLAEQHRNADLYREASRFVLDQPTWDQYEMEALSEQTQLKLSKRRNWFLERLLKLGSIDVKKEYTCRADCPDPARCQSSLDEKWRQAHMAVSRYGPPQPSVAFRCLRQLETFPTNPSLVMPHPLCQSAAKSWVMSLFDRMFQPKLLSTNPGTEKYWLWISMN